MSDRAVIFDLDETLFDRRGSLRLFLEAQFRKRSFSIAVDVNGLIDRFLELDNRGRNPKREVYETLLNDLGLFNDALCVELFNEYEQNFWRYAHAFIDMDTMFNELKSAGFRTAIVSNGETHIQIRSILALNLDRIVDAYLISEAEGVRKPELEIFSRSAERLSVQPARCIFVGDSPEADIAGAKRAGMKTIWFPNGARWPSGATVQPDAEIRSLIEVSGLAKKWMAIS